MRKTLYYFLFLIAMLILTFSCEKHKSIEELDKKFLNSIELETLTNEEQKCLLDSLYEVSKLIHNKAVSRDYLLQLASKFDEINDSIRFKEVLHKTIRFSREEHDTLSMGKAYESLGMYYENKIQFDSAYYYFNKAEQKYTLLLDSLKIGEMAISKASILYDFGIYSESENEAIRAINHFNDQEDMGFYYECYQLLGLILCEKRDFQSSLNYYDKTLKMLKEIESKKYFDKQDVTEAYVALYNNIGGVFELKEDFQKAVDEYEKAFALNGIENINPLLYAALLNNRAFSKIKLGKTQGVLVDLHNAYKIRDSLSRKHELIMSKLTMAEYYFSIGDTLKGLEYVKTSYQKSEQIKNLRDKKKSLQYLLKYDLQNNADYTEQYINLSEEIRTKEQATKYRFARIAYETEEIENRNKQLILLQKYIIITTCLITLLLLTLLFVFRLSFRNKKLKLSNQQQQINEKIYQMMINQQEQMESVKNDERKRIAKDLHDGIVNRIFTTRFNLMQLETPMFSCKELLIEELVRAEEEIRNLSHQLLEKSKLTENSFKQILEDLVLKQRNSFNTTFSLSIDQTIDWNLVSGEIKLNMYRILQEILQNVNKYSQAEKCTVLFVKKNKDLFVKIIDNGVGFNVFKRGKGIGLTNIEERVNSIQGKFSLQSSVGEGTQIEIYIMDLFNVN